MRHIIIYKVMFMTIFCVIQVTSSSSNNINQNIYKADLSPSTHSIEKELLLILFANSTQLSNQKLIQKDLSLGDILNDEKAYLNTLKSSLRSVLGNKKTTENNRHISSLNDDAYNDTQIRKNRDNNNKQNSADMIVSPLKTAMNTKTTTLMQNILQDVASSLGVSISENSNNTDVDRNSQGNIFDKNTQNTFTFHPKPESTFSRASISGSAPNKSSIKETPKAYQNQAYKLLGLDRQICATLEERCVYPYGTPDSSCNLCLCNGHWNGQYCDSCPLHLTCASREIPSQVQITLNSEHKLVTSASFFETRKLIPDNICSKCVCPAGYYHVEPSKLATLRQDNKILKHNQVTNILTASEFCLDLDECALDVNNTLCDPNVQCINTPGSYYCSSCDQYSWGSGKIGCYPYSTTIVSIISFALFIYLSTKAEAGAGVFEKYLKMYFYRFSTFIIQRLKHHEIPVDILLKSHDEIANDNKTKKGLPKPDFDVGNNTAKTKERTPYSISSMEYEEELNTRDILEIVSEMAQLSDTAN